MKKTYYYFLMLIAVSVFGSQANAQMRCGFDIIHEQQLKNNPKLRQSLAEADRIWAQYATAQQQAAARLTIEGTDTVYEIPVVIHVLHTGGAIGTSYNPSDATLEAWIDYLNESYAATYPGYPTVGNGGTRLPLKFVLAKRDPACNATTGIVRVDMSSNSTYVNNGLNAQSTSGLTSADLQAVSNWPSGAYYNLYVVNKIDGEDGNCTSCSFIAGFAYLGQAAYVPLDGAYMLASTATPGNITLPHELGHAFGLYHVFQGGNASTCPPNNSCVSENDRVCDTDPSVILLGSCPSSGAINGCTGSPYGINGVQHNFMNYSTCQNHFTQGQADRMMFMLTNYRQSLIRSLGAVPPPASHPTPIAATCQPLNQSNPGASNVGPCNVFLDSIQYYSNGFIVTTQDNTDQFYIDHTATCALATSTTLIAEDTYQLSVSTEDNAQSIYAYIDYNNDGDFNDVSETVLVAPSNPAGNVYSVNLIPPPTAVMNTPLRMRVVADANNPSLGPCSDLVYGQAEDFMVTVIPNEPMALGLIDFSGRIAGKQEALLSWTIEPNMPEINKFVLERSINGRHFEPVAQLNREEGRTEYQHKDRTLHADQVNFYRLKIGTIDGASSYSEVVALQFDQSADGAIAVFPNPTEGILTVKSAMELQEITLLNSQGQPVYQTSKIPDGKQDIQINVRNLPSGIYWLQVVDNSGARHFRKVSKL